MRDSYHHDGDWKGGSFLDVEVGDSLQSRKSFGIHDDSQVDDEPVLFSFKVAGG